MIDEPPLQLVGRLVDRLAIVLQHVADADVHVIALGKDVGVSFVRLAAGVRPVPVRRRLALGLPGAHTRRPPTASTDRRRAASSRGVSSIMSSATAAAGQPGLMPSRRATTLCTPSAAMTSGASNRRPSRATSATPCVVHRCLDDVRAGHQLGARFDGQRHQQRIELDAADHHAAGPSDSIDRRLAVRALRDAAGTAGASRSATSAGSRYGNRFSARRLIPPPHGLFLGNGDRSSRQTGTPASASVRAAVAPAGPAPTTMADGVMKSRVYVADEVGDWGESHGIQWTEVTVASRLLGQACEAVKAS